MELSVPQHNVALNIVELEEQVDLLVTIDTICPVTWTSLHAGGILVRVGGWAKSNPHYSVREGNSVGCRRECAIPHVGVACSSSAGKEG